MKKKIKVLHIVLGLKIGGLEKFVIELIKNTANEVNPAIACIENLESILDESWVQFPVYELNKKPGVSYSVPFKLSRIIRNIGIEIIHTHNPSPHFYGALAGLISRVPVIHTKHGRNNPNSSRKVWLNRIAALLSEKIIAVSDDACEICKNIEKIPEKKVAVIRNGIDINTFRPTVKNKKFFFSVGIPETALIIGCVARLSPEKDHHTLFKAFKIISEFKKNMYLVIIGDGPLRGELEKLSNELKLKDRIIFTGARDDVNLLLPELDIFVLSSTTEGISLTLLEAMACGLPVVATNVGGTPEVVTDADSGFLVATKNFSEMAEKIMLLVENTKLREEMGKVGKARVEKYFNITSVANNYVSTYREIIENW
jgi:sugar transferase (PEP-CTERM/EpsH1 system associated)